MNRHSKVSLYFSSGKWVCGQCKTEKKSPPSVKETKETNVSESPFGKKGNRKVCMCAETVFSKTFLLCIFYA